MPPKSCQKAWWPKSNPQSIRPPSDGENVAADPQQGKKEMRLNFEGYRTVRVTSDLVDKLKLK